MKVAVTGASGLIGSALVPSLRSHGHDVVRFVRRPPAAPDERPWAPERRELDPVHLADVDAVVHLAGAGVGDQRWSDRRKAVVLGSRVDGTTAVARAVAASGRTRVLLSASGVGFYGDTGDRLTDESGAGGDDFLAEVCRQWEAAADPARAGARVAHLRTGIVLSGRGGALGKQLPVFRAGLGAPLGDGRQYVPWISLDDEVGAITHLLTADVSGPVNLVGPQPVTNRAFTTAMGRVLRRPTLPVGVPGPLLRIVLGEFAQVGVLTGQRLRPAVLERSGYRFAHADVETALRAVLARPA